jgi:hypothetical protein
MKVGTGPGAVWHRRNLILIMKKERNTRLIKCWFNSFGGCMAGVATECRPEGCGFYKTKAEHDKSTRAWKERLQSLPESTQMAISEKYYNGRRPWNK